MKLPKLTGSGMSAQYYVAGSGRNPVSYSISNPLSDHILKIRDGAIIDRPGLMTKDGTRYVNGGLGKSLGRETKITAGLTYFFLTNGAELFEGQLDIDDLVLGITQDRKKLAGLTLHWVNTVLSGKAGSFEGYELMTREDPLLAEVIALRALDLEEREDSRDYLDDSNIIRQLKLTNRFSSVKVLTLLEERQRDIRLGC